MDPIRWSVYCDMQFYIFLDAVNTAMLLVLEWFKSLLARVDVSSRLTESLDSPKQDVVLAAAQGLRETRFMSCHKIDYLILRRLTTSGIGGTYIRHICTIWVGGLHCMTWIQIPNSSVTTTNIITIYSMYIYIYVAVHGIHEHSMNLKLNGTDKSKQTPWSNSYSSETMNM